MIRSGSTLQFQLASAIVERAGIGSRVEYTPEAQFESVRSRFPEAERTLRVFKAHVCAPALARECEQGRARVVYSYRDIRDVAVSSVRKFGMSLEQLLEDGWLDQAIADYYRWTALPDVSVSRYEEMFHDVAGEARKINAHLGAPLAPAVVDELARSYTLEEQRLRVERIKASQAARISNGEVVFDPRELLHHNHIHSGELGGWRRLLTPAQRDALTERFSDWLQATGYGLE
jgi:hypothetical protein